MYINKYNIVSYVFILRLIKDKSRTYLNNELCKFSLILSLLGQAYVKHSNITKCMKI